MVFRSEIHHKIVCNVFRNPRLCREGLIVLAHVCARNNSVQRTAVVWCSHTVHHQYLPHLTNAPPTDVKDHMTHRIQLYSVNWLGNVLFIQLVQNNVFIIMLLSRG